MEENNYKIAKQFIISFIIFQFVLELLSLNLISIGVLIILSYFLYKGHNWARIVLILLLIYSIVFSGFNIIGYGAENMNTLILIFFTIYKIIFLFFLSNPRITESLPEQVGPEITSKMPSFFCLSNSFFISFIIPLFSILIYILSFYLFYQSLYQKVSDNQRTYRDV